MRSPSSFKSAPMEGKPGWTGLPHEGGPDAASGGQMLHKAPDEEQGGKLVHIPFGYGGWTRSTS